MSSSHSSRNSYSLPHSAHANCHCLRRFATASKSCFVTPRSSPQQRPSPPPQPPQHTQAPTSLQLSYLDNTELGNISQSSSQASPECFRAQQLPLRPFTPPCHLRRPAEESLTDAGHATARAFDRLLFCERREQCRRLSSSQP
jgi:hypothetical protein